MYNPEKPVPHAPGSIAITSVELQQYALDILSITDEHGVMSYSRDSWLSTLRVVKRVYADAIRKS